MKTCEEHCEHTRKRYGISGREIHEWMDSPVKVVGALHRKFRHDIKKDLPAAHAIFDRYYGPTMVENIFLDHLIADSPKKNRKEAFKDEKPIMLPGERYIKLRCGWVRNDSNNFVPPIKLQKEDENKKIENTETK